MDQMPAVLAELQALGGASEFHFVDIYNGSGPYRQMSRETRLAFFALFAEVAISQDLRFVHQSIDQAASATLITAAQGLPKVPGLLNPASNKDLSRMLLLLKLKAYLSEHLAAGECAPVFMDEGWKKNGKAVRIPTWHPPFIGGMVVSANSSDVWGLQFADFAAFVLNRSQIMAARDRFSDLDIAFLEIASRIMPLFADGVELTLIQLEEE